MKNFLQFLFCILLAEIGFAQTQLIAYPAVGKGVATTFLTDYHCLGINASALGWGTGYENKRFTTGSTEFGFSFYSDSLSSQKLRNLVQAIRGQVKQDGSGSLNYQDQKEAAGIYAEAGIAMQINYNWGGFAFQSEKFGGIAFSVREDYRWYSRLNKQTADIIFRGKLSSYFDSLTIVVAGDTSTIANSDQLSQDTLGSVISGSFSVPLKLSQLTKGTEIQSVWNRSYSLGYGRKLIGNKEDFALYVGMAGRLIQSVAMFNFRSDDDGVYMYSSISPNFNIDYGPIALFNPSTYAEKGKFLPKVVGSGFGLDLAGSMIVGDFLKVAASVNNIGGVTYKRNVYKINDTLMSNFSLNGLSDVNITQSINQLLSDGGILKLQGQENYFVANAADLRLGASIYIKQVLSVGVDLVAPFNKNAPGSIQNAVYSFGGELRPVKWLAFSAGYIGGGIYQKNIPMGVNFILRDGAYEFGCSSYDILSMFTSSSNSVSGAFGFARVRF